MLVARSQNQRLDKEGIRARPATRRERASASTVVSGAHAKLPFAREIQRSFGDYDISKVRTTTGGGAARITAAFGASAFTMGERIAFDQAPTLQVAAHEAAHVVQQRAGVAVPGLTGTAKDAYERAADAVADAVTAGADAGPLLDRSDGARARVPRRSIGPNASPLQFFFVKEQWRGVKESPDIKVDWRISDDFKLALSQEHGADGGRHCYAAKALIQQADKILAKQNSSLEIKPTTETLEIPDLQGRIARLNRVFPRNLSNNTEGNDVPLESTEAMTPSQRAKVPGMSLIDDCGLGANAILHQKGLATRAVYNRQSRVDLGGHLLDDEGASSRPSVMLPVPAETGIYDYGENYYRTKADDYYSQRQSPDMMKEEIFAAASGKNRFEAWNDYLKQRNIPSSEDESFQSRMQRQAEATEDTDVRLGINQFAQPNVGEAYSIVRERDDGVVWPKNRRPWPFHWGAVILRSGGDSVTLETFARAGDDNWNYQMYGPPSHNGQTFHEQHMVHTRDGVPAIGLNPTTIRVRGAIEE